MNPIEIPPSSPRTNAAAMYASVLTVGLVCSLAIVTVYELTQPIILRNRTALREVAVLDVLPGSTRSIAFRQEPDAVFRAIDQGPSRSAEMSQQRSAHNDTSQRAAAERTAADPVFAGYDDQGRLIGVAIEAQGHGYQDVIKLIYGYSFETQSILAMRVLQSRETPGLGDRIETDSDFQANFGALDVRLNEAADAVARPIRLAGAGEPAAAWEIDGITGATITCRAVADILRESTQHWIPRLFPRRADFQSPSIPHS
jgi:Na+-translocating ferredoxin:NAD+ oxidoreductase subunit G